MTTSEFAASAAPADAVRRPYLAPAAGDLAALRATLAGCTAAHQGTGRPIDVRVEHHFVVRGGLIVRFEQSTAAALVRDAMSP
nr:hypothetical protein [Streptomyces sp. SID5643]